MSDFTVHRPYQYLGSKLRAMDSIVAAVCSPMSRGAVLDVFTGSSVVAQAVAARSRRVVASDALEFTTEVAGALLAVDRPDHSPTPQELLQMIGVLSEPSLAEEWREWIDAEARALEEENIAELQALYETMPLAWRPESAPLPSIKRVQGCTHSGASDGLALMTAFYAGTYFGVAQAVALDSIRSAISRLSASLSDKWAIRCCNAALIAAASEAVFSAGKHFAQPLSLTGAHAQRRVFCDRAVNVHSSFALNLKNIQDSARPRDEGHTVFHRTLEDWPDHLNDLAGVDTIYADPPYTAEQYSRFYHIPETLFTQKVPDIITRMGQPTRGLYPSGRHRSRFSRRGDALAAFEDLMRLARNTDARLVLSYSHTGRDSGNSRMVTLEDLVSVADSILGGRPVAVTQLDHQYRQFNRRALASNDAGSLEYLMVIG